MTGIVLHVCLSHALAQTTPQQHDAVLQRQAIERQARLVDEQMRSEQHLPQVSGLPNPAQSASVHQFVSDEKPCFLIRQVLLDGQDAKAFLKPLQSIIAGTDAEHGLPSPIGHCLGAQSIQVNCTSPGSKAGLCGYKSHLTMQATRPRGNIRPPSRDGSLLAIEAKPIDKSHTIQLGISGLKKGVIQLDSNWMDRTLKRLPNETANAMSTSRINKTISRFVFGIEPHSGRPVLVPLRFNKE